MGYNTTFKGRFNLDKKLDEKTYDLLEGLADTRRVARNIDGYGIDGEFYIDGGGFMGQEIDDSVINFNRPPRTQPGLWLKWRPTGDGMAIEWNRAENFYNYVEWIEYIIDSILRPRGYTLNGLVEYRGEDFRDLGSIEVIDNKVIHNKFKVIK